MEVAIGGAGVAGLAASIALVESGHKVTVYESRPNIEMVCLQRRALSAKKTNSLSIQLGAGIQMAPNMTRLLRELGLHDLLQRDVVKPQTYTIRRWSNGAIIGGMNMGEFETKFGSPYIQVRRCELLDALSNKAQEKGVVFRFGAKISRYEPEVPLLVLGNGEEIRPDFVVAADARRSGVARTKVIPELAGRDHHVQAYSMNGNKHFNMVWVAPSRGHEDAQATCDDGLQELRQQFLGWDPTYAGLPHEGMDSLSLTGE
ncbi:MAG: hypothetical protein Q9159_002656 [Coniocarpon cinnabarinum]